MMLLLAWPKSGDLKIRLTEGGIAPEEEARYDDGGSLRQRRRHFPVVETDIVAAGQEQPHVEAVNVEPVPDAEVGGDREGHQEVEDQDQV